MTEENFGLFPEISSSDSGLDETTKEESTELSSPSQAWSVQTSELFLNAMTMEMFHSEMLHRNWLMSTGYVPISWTWWVAGYPDIYCVVFCHFLDGWPFGSEEAHVSLVIVRSLRAKVGDACIQTMWFFRGCTDNMRWVRLLEESPMTFVMDKATKSWLTSKRDKLLKDIRPHLEKDDKVTKPDLRVTWNPLSLPPSGYPCMVYSGMHFQHHPGHL